MRKNGRPARRAAGELESDILTALWSSTIPLGTLDVQTAVGGDLAYNTVHTVLVRLLAKGEVVRVLHEGRRVYMPVNDSSGAAVERLRAVLDSGVDREEVLARFVGTLDHDEEMVIRAALRKIRRC